MVDVDVLVYCGVSKKKATIYAPIIDKYAPKFGINTKMRMAHFLAQVLHESGCFYFTEEIASGSLYEGRKDLGNVYPGDGKKFKGRGLIQLTGRANYMRLSKYFGINFVDAPDLLETPLWATVSAMWFWETHKLNERADRDELTNITKIINGGLNGKAQRLSYLGKAKRALGLINK